MEACSSPDTSPAITRISTEDSGGSIKLMLCISLPNRINLLGYSQGNIQGRLPEKDPSVFGI